MACMLAPRKTLRSRILVPVLAISFSAAAAGAASADDFDCSNPEAQQAMNYCAAQEFRKLDGELTKLYQEALAHTKEQDKLMPTPEGPDLKTETEALTIAETSWLKYRDAHCDGMGYKARGGSLEALLVGNCKIELTKNRMKELKEIATNLEDL